MTAWTFGAVGDVFVNRPDPGTAFRGCSDLLRRLDLVFGNCEGAYTDSPHFAPSAGWRVIAPTACGRGLGEAGFHVMALANNHILDAGHEGLHDTRALSKPRALLRSELERTSQRPPHTCNRRAVWNPDWPPELRFRLSGGIRSQKQHAWPCASTHSFTLFRPGLGCIRKGRTRCPAAGAYNPLS